MVGGVFCRREVRGENVARAAVDNEARSYFGGRRGGEGWFVFHFYGYFEFGEADWLN